MVNYNDLRSLIEQRGFKFTAFCSKIGMTRQGVESAMVNETVSARVLKKMSEVLHVPVSFFFNETEKEEHLLKSKSGKICTGCIDKERIIGLMQDKIDYLEKALEESGVETKKARPA